MNRLLPFIPAQRSFYNKVSQPTLVTSECLDRQISQITPKYPPLSAFYFFCTDITSEPTVTTRLKEELRLNKRESKEIVALYCKEVLAVLDDGEQVKLHGFSNLDLLDSSQPSGSNLKNGEPRLLIDVRRRFAGFNNPRSKSKLSLDPDHNA
jgi:nucleoid DNA-binding protein